MSRTHQSKVIIGLSGGVDSSVAAALLQEAGYHVEGLFMKNWEEDDAGEYCAAADDLKDVEAICERLNIPLHTVNFASEYWDHVFTHFLEQLRYGLTPNPDILCNKEIKFKAFLSHAKTLGADYISTGHYARIRPPEAQQKNYQLLTGIDCNKDQSYFLYTLGQHALKSSLFPIGPYEKPWVREYAENKGLITHDKKDSTGICFIGERRFKTFLETYLPAQPGRITDKHGKTLGEHDGLMYYTLGQRKGLNIGGMKNSSGEPWFVAQKSLTDNTLVVVQGEDPLLYSKSTLIADCDWSSPEAKEQALTTQRLTVKTRYRQTAVPAQLSVIENNQLKVTFATPQRAVTPGQSLVCYLDEVCLGGGIIQ